MNRRRLPWLIIVLALAARLALFSWAGNAPETPFTGGSDTLRYQTLADNLAHHRGFTYAGVPTALRAPLYPLFLALLQVLTGVDRYRLVARLIQLLAGIAIAILCGKASETIGGSGPVALAAALVFPTQIFFQAEILTETFATLLVAAFFFAVLKNKSPLSVGAVIGLGMLERFNLANLAVVYVCAQLYQCVGDRRQALKNISLAALVAFLIVSPWFVRNLVAFDGEVFYSTQTSLTFLSAIVTPDGRTTGSDWDRLESLCGFTVLDIETNAVSRQAFPAEPELDRKARRAAWDELAHFRATDLIYLAIRKLGLFWLSTDQAFATQELPPDKRLERFAGVLAYWILLAAGLKGWFALRKRNPNAAAFFAIYAIAITLMHLPFTMSTRIRSPLVDPLLAILAGCAFTAQQPQNERPGQCPAE